jgi:hypothetical protein
VERHLLIGAEDGDPMPVERRRVLRRLAGGGGRQGDIEPAQRCRRDRADPSVVNWLTAIRSPPPTRSLSQLPVRVPSTLSVRIALVTSRSFQPGSEDVYR